MRYLLTALLLGIAGLATVEACAHELRPASLTIRQTAPQLFDVTWRVPARNDRRLSLQVQFDPQAERRSLPAGQMASGYFAERWQVSHPRDLLGSTIAIEGLGRTLTDTLVRISWLDGREQLERLLPDRPRMTVKNKPGPGHIAATYFTLGVEHILLGIDHLLFVLALMLLARGGRQLVGTVTAFTVAHSITLAAAVLGLVSVPQGPVEAVIALSIVFVASEVIYQLRGSKTLAIRRPWVVAFGFGLLHGLGFAGALTEIGVPQHAIPLALALFNIGVEAGQLLFIAAVGGALLVVQRIPPVQRWELRTGRSTAALTAAPVAYLVGGLAAWWLIERSLALFL